MNKPDQAWWERARAARDKLEARVLQNPDVRMISIGFDPEHQSSEPVLIVYLRRGAMVPSIPNQIDGIVVRVTHGEFEAQEGAP
jgi:hypothetical protein